MSEERDVIQARFAATPDACVIAVKYGPLVCQITWPRADDPDGDVRRLRTLIANLPEVLNKGTEEIWMQDQARRLDYELDEFFRELDERGDEGKGDK